MRTKQYNMKYLWWISLVATLGGFLFGYDWVVISGAKPFYQSFFGLTSKSDVGWAVSCALVGCLAGAFLSGLLSDRFGRKRLLIAAGVMFTVSAIGTALAHTFNVFVLYRILGGIGIGLTSNLSPMYISETTPANIRGRFVSINQLAIVVGIFIAPLINLLISDPVALEASSSEILNTWNGQSGWRWMFAAEAVPAMLFTVLMMLVPESPRWLMKNGQKAKAKDVFKNIGGEQYSAIAIKDIEETLVNEVKQVHFKELLEKKMILVLLLGVFLAVFQQWCGINTVFLYAHDIFEAAGFSVSGMLVNIVILGLVFFSFTFVAIFTVDHIGRKTLMLIGSAGLSSAYFLIGGSYFFQYKGVIVLLLVIIACAFYSFSLAPVVWVLLSEIFPNRIRGAAMAVATLALWTGSFLITYGFPILKAKLGNHGIFWLYSLVCFAGFLLTKMFVPETKGKTLEQIEKELVD
jgi:SP family sugar porter-like MFS transporter